MRCYLIHHLRGHLIVIRDGASVNDPKSLSELLRKYPRPHLVRLPALRESTKWRPTGMELKCPLADGRSVNIRDISAMLW